jgi:hypothetical protein
MSQVDHVSTDRLPPGSVPRRQPWGRITLLVSLVGAIVLTVAVMVAGAATDPARPAIDAPIGNGTTLGDPAVAAAPSWERPVVSPDGLVDRIGIRVVQVALTGGGGLIDVRFQVLDPNKAAAVHDPITPPALVDDRTSVVANDLLMGHSHAGAFKAGLTYFLMFENPGNVVQRGDTVSVLLGNTQLDHIEVQ